MSLGIERSRISAVLIANEWIRCKPGSFYIDAYEFMWHREQRDDLDWNNMKKYGFAFERASDSFCVFGPMSSIQAVSYNPSEEVAP